MRRLPIAQPGKQVTANSFTAVAKKAEFAGLYRGFPTILTCSRQGCMQRNRAALGLR